MDGTRTVEVPPENESTEWLLRLQAWAHGGDALLLEAADELSKLRKDAERYRWLRDDDGAFEAFTAAYYNAPSRAEIDAAIDAAMATGGGAVGAA